MKFSIVSTLYNSSLTLLEFYSRITSAVKKITDSYEIILVDDGSSDDSVSIAKKIQQLDQRITIVELSRNFGQHRAIMTGLSYAKGENVFLIDSDLEESPEIVDLFWQKMCNSDDDVVYGVQNKRKGDWFEKLSGFIFFKIMNFLSDIKIPRNVILARLMKKHYVKNLLLHKERELAFVGVAVLNGFKQSSIPVNKGRKNYSSYTLTKKINMAINFITSLSAKPLISIFYLGIMITIFSIFFIIYFLFRKLLSGIEIQGWTSLMLSVWFIGGIIIFCLGILSLYLSKIFSEVKQRPYTIVKNIHSHDKGILHDMESL